MTRTDQVLDRCAIEHEGLLATCEQVCSLLCGVRDKIESSWLNDLEFAECLELQAHSLVAAKDLAARGYYRDAYNTLRMILEGYLLFRLVWLGTIYTQRFRVRPGPGEDLASARARFIADAKSGLGRDFAGVSEQEKGIVEIKRRGIHVVDASGKKTGRMMPVYWHAWKQYRPDHFLKRQRIKSPRFLPGEWAIAGTKPARPADKHSSDLYQRFFSFEKFLRNMETNRFLNKKQATRVVVHYNFLSMFTHSTYESRRQLTDGRFYNQFDGLEYDHYNSELALLYVAHLGVMHSQFVDDYADRWKVQIEGRGEREARTRDVEAKFGYFWFIFNEPHRFDKYEYANRKSDYRKSSIVRPDDVKAAHVRYYDDPLRRLKDLHHSSRELSTGNIFESPFPRSDALR